MRRSILPFGCVVETCADGSCMGCKLSELIRREWIIPDLVSSSKEGALGEIARRMSKVSTEIDPTELFTKLVERENKASTGADQGLAIPHASLHTISHLIVAVCRSSGGVDFGALDNERSKIFFTIVSPARTLESGEVTYLQVISSVCKFMRAPSVRNRILAAENADEIYDILTTEEHVRESKLAMAL